jgi:L-threonylcarbamoyladenylate synthase
MNALTDAMKIQVSTYAQILKGGGVVAFPTETVYGLGASADKPTAIAKVFDLKGRPSDNPLIVHVSTYGMLLQYAADIPAESRILMQKFWPGPLTLIFEKKSQVLDMITAGLSSVAIRMPDHLMALSLIDLTGPLVAPSANKSGKPSPTRASHVTEDFGRTVPILDGGDCVVGLESTVLDVRASPFRILRPGIITPKMIFDKTGIIVQDGSASDSEAIVPSSPGMKYTHYAPDTPVRWMTDSEVEMMLLSPETMYLILDLPVMARRHSGVIHFDNDLNRFARELYDWFRQSDRSDYSEIAVQPLDKNTDNELVAALKNRIQKAIKK